MQIVNTIELKLIAEATDTKESLCEVIVENEAKNILIRGKVLEQAIYVKENRYLIFTTDDVVFEESLNIYLVEQGIGVLDKLWIGQPYNTDTFGGLNIIDDCSLSFSFLYERDWKLTIHERAKISWSIFHWLSFFKDSEFLDI